MKTTRILSLLLALMLILGMALTFVSCGGSTATECTEHKDGNGDGICDTEGCGKAVEKTTDIPADTFNENGELYLFKGGVPTFRFVVGADSLAKHLGTVEELAGVLNGLCVDGTEIACLAQGDGEPCAVEILVGTVTNRGDEYNINKYDYGNTGYVVKQIGTKLVVTGGSDTAVASALNYLKNTVFGIKKNNDKFGDFVMAADKTYDKPQDNYSLKEITIAGNSIKDYVISYPSGDTTAKENAEALQTDLYKNCGIRLECLVETRAEGKAKIVFRTLKNDGEGEGFYVYVDEDKNLNLECEYATRSKELTEKYLTTQLFNQKSKFDFKANYSYVKDYRNIYYKDYAKGDGKTDDFFALKTVHDLANENLLNVHADPDQTYYIGNANGNQSIIVKTNTYWNGCNFIFDDETVTFNTPGMGTPIFIFYRDSDGQEFTEEASPVKSLEKGQTNIGWAPGHKVMLIIYNNNVKHYIRHGANADSGQAQHELIIVDKDGNVDPTTPIQWTYETVTSMVVYNVDDRPIEIKGEGKNGKRTTITTHYNNGPSAYWYYERNLYVKRSNVTISGIEHIIDKYVPYADGGSGSPYHGFTFIAESNNVVIDNFIFQAPEVYYDNEPILRPSWHQITNGMMGSYEINAEESNNIIWRNCTQSNFFEPDGTVIFKGPVGTNFCKNLTYDNMKVTSFDAHCGVYNGTIKNSMIEHINFIGAGTITLENVTLYADGFMHSVINLRDDYGSTWDGDVNIDGLTIKIRTMDEAGKMKLHNEGGIRIINAMYTNHFFGYTTHLPKNITIRNILLEEYEVAIVNDVRVETHIAYNTIDVKIFKNEFSYASYDFYRDDTINGSANQNKMVPTEKIEYYTTYTGKYAELGIEKPLNIIFPNKQIGNGEKYTMFKDTEYWVDGVLS